jgi:hypothetical protein
VEHIIEFDTTIPPSQQMHYCMNPNYMMVIKQDLDKLLAIGFIKLVEQATWLSLIVIVLNRISNYAFALIFKS